MVNNVKPIDYNGRFPTPNLPVDESLSVLISTAKTDPLLTGNIVGAVSMLFNEFMFDKFGDASPYEASRYYEQAEIITMDFCEYIADCIANNVATQNALREFIGGSDGNGIPSGGDYGSGVDTPIPATTNSENIMGNANCDNDNMYAVAVAITDLAFNAVEQLFDVLEFAQAQGNLVAELADNFGVATGAPAVALDWARWVAETAAAAFRVFDTANRRQDIACDIFCIMVEQNCQLSFDDIKSYFVGKSPIGINGQTLRNVLISQVNLLSAESVGYSSLGLLFGALALGASWGGIRNVGGFLTNVFAFIDETNNNWNTDCDPCTFDPCALPIRIDWNDYLMPECASYVGNKDLIRSDMGNPAPSDYFTDGNQTGYKAVGVQIDLPVGTQSVTVQADHLGYVETSPSLNGVAYHQFFDASGTKVHEGAYNVTAPNVWQTRITSYSHSGDIAYVRVFTAVSLGNAAKDVTQALDNIVVS